MRGDKVMVIKESSGRREKEDDGGGRERGQEGAGGEEKEEGKWASPNSIASCLMPHAWSSQHADGGRTRRNSSPLRGQRSLQVCCTHMQIALQREADGDG